MIYLAGPYAHEDVKIMEERFNKLTRYAGELMKLGVLVYSPITHNHPIATRIELPRTWDYWRDFDLAVLSRCSQLIVLKLPGWNKSVGVNAEMEYCRANNIPIVFATP